MGTTSTRSSSRNFLDEWRLRQPNAWAFAARNIRAGLRSPLNGRCYNLSATPWAQTSAVSDSARGIPDAIRFTMRWFRFHDPLEEPSSMVLAARGSNESWYGPGGWTPNPSMPDSVALRWTEGLSSIRLDRAVVGDPLLGTGITGSAVVGAPPDLARITGVRIPCAPPSFQ